ncbi:hypothetical protein FIBSPDRAFT_962372 [Athelia psychrophila]|uniref:Uncharacterized protein n=1 Tax=Athelia psychrophila TaxID=1759441 RepID=A0A166A9V0_9AGAM|nr:hypothetical protein FIBSPDRAFT_962372 [Fibularhizoctonia sp. CBS 109695]
MDRQDFSRLTATASVTEQGMDTIFGPTHWTAFVNPGSDPTAPHKTTRLPSSTPSPTPASSIETAVAMANAGGPFAQGCIGGSGMWIPFKGLLRRIKHDCVKT